MAMIIDRLLIVITITIIIVKIIIKTWYNIAFPLILSKSIFTNAFLSKILI